MKKIWGVFIYKRSKENNNLWYLAYPKDIQDTIVLQIEN